MRVKFKTYNIIERAVEEGIAAGWRRAHKHTESPDEETIKPAILEAVMLQLEEVIDYDEGR